jgi:hypothetical protein
MQFSEHVLCTAQFMFLSLVQFSYSDPALYEADMFPYQLRGNAETCVT